MDGSRWSSPLILFGILWVWYLMVNSQKVFFFFCFGETKRLQQLDCRWEARPDLHSHSRTAAREVWMRLLLLTSGWKMQTMPPEWKGLANRQIDEWRRADRWRWWTNRAGKSKDGGREHQGWGQTVRLFPEVKHGDDSREAFLEAFIWALFSGWHHLPVLWVQEFGDFS